jgi:tubulin polyglutamylase TTLL6/13
MRVYIVVTSVDPLRVYLFKDGLVRLATEPYVVPTAKNLAHTRMHLTNYAINKVCVWGGGECWCVDPP